MTDKIAEATGTEQGAVPRTAYLRPQLIHYGPLNSRTTSGTVSGGEHTGVGNKDKKA